MPTTKEWICPDETYKDLLSKIGSSPVSNNVPSPQTIAFNKDKTQPIKVINHSFLIQPQTTQRVISIQGASNIMDILFVIRNPMVSLQSTDIKIIIDNSTVTSNMLKRAILAKKSKHFKIDYYEDVLNVNPLIATTMTSAGSMFYAYSMSPFAVAINFEVFITNNYTAPYAIIAAETLIEIRGI